MTNTKRYIGLSLSLCMQDILKGDVKIEDISAIVASTAFKDTTEALLAYYDYYWANITFLKKCDAILKNIWPIVFQPRLNVGKENHIGHTVTKGHWLDTFTGQVFIHYEPDEPCEI